jgi:hypothetical protein
MPSVGPLLILIVFLFAVLALWIIQLRQRQRRFFRSIQDSIILKRDKFDIKLEEKYKSIRDGSGVSKGLTDILKEKTQRFLETPSVAFHFSDNVQIETFYNDLFREPTIESLVSEITQELKADIKGSVPQVIEARLGGKDIGKWVRTIKLPDTTLSGMFVRYQRETIKSGQVTIGLEEVDIELNDLQDFDEAVDNLSKRFNLAIPSELESATRSELKQKAAERTLVRLENATGWLLVEGRFRITRHNEFYRCTYTHPVGEYLPGNVGPVTLSFSLDSGKVEPRVSGNYAQSIDQLIPLKVYGKVWQPIDRAKQSWELQITPLAVY